MAHFLQLLFYRKNAFVHVGNYNNVPVLCQLLIFSSALSVSALSMLLCIPLSITCFAAYL